MRKNPSVPLWMRALLFGGEWFSTPRDPRLLWLWGHTSDPRQDRRPAQSLPGTPEVGRAVYPQCRDACATGPVSPRDQKQHQRATRSSWASQATAALHR